ncbi:MAG: F0F1 ATP synthase subunit B [Erysipelotrichaceae bacterium]|nr:F0F1 ATP synthase subunit B [Erysipelotrichaceae bacterium]
MTFDIEGVLFPNLLTMLVQLCSTVVLFLLCKKLLWTPARKILETRRQKMNADLENARKLQQEATADLEEARNDLARARDRSDEIVKEARREAQELRDEIVSSARKEARDVMSDADKTIALKKKEAREEIHDEMVSVAMAAVSRLLEEKAGSEDDEKAIRDYISEVKGR